MHDYISVGGVVRPSTIELLNTKGNDRVLARILTLAKIFGHLIFSGTLFILASLFLYLSYFIHSFCSFYTYLLFYPQCSVKLYFGD